MSDSRIGGNRNLWLGMIALAFALVALAVIYHTGLIFMVSEWAQEEYSHGYLIPPITAFLLWRQRQHLFAQEWQGAWIGVAGVIISSFVFLMGDLSALYIIVQYAFLMAVFAIAFSLIGWRGMKYALAPLIYLVFMIPLPDFLYNSLSANLQLISSEWGVAVIRFFGISVFLEGNVIDLGSFQLQVVEACSGLRYLFPLMSFGFLLAYLFKAPMWQRAVVFLVTIPITVVMNSFRIGVIGVLVDKFGPEQAEGFIHAFEGWIIFMACVVILFAVMKLLMVITRDKRDLRDATNLDLGEPADAGAVHENMRYKWPFFTAVAVLCVVAVGAMSLDERKELIPERQRFAEFNLQIGDWKGVQVPVEQKYLDTLKLDDYLGAKFAKPSESTVVDTWIAYYSTQRKGVAIHSPKTCLPGGGWQINEFEVIEINDIPEAGGPLKVNRAIMRQGKDQLLIYYWFKQRERNIASEYALKWYLFWDSLSRQRTDGALMRLIVSAPDGVDLDKQEAVLREFMRDSYAELSEFVPD